VKVCLQAVCKRGGFDRTSASIHGDRGASVEVGAGLLKRRMTKHVLHVVHGPTGFEQARASFVTEVVEVQVDRQISRF